MNCVKNECASIYTYMYFLLKVITGVQLNRKDMRKYEIISNICEWFVKYFEFLHLQTLIANAI